MQGTPRQQQGAGSDGPGKKGVWAWLFWLAIRLHGRERDLALIGSDLHCGWQSHGNHLFIGSPASRQRSHRVAWTPSGDSHPSVPLLRTAPTKRFLTPLLLSALATSPSLLFLGSRRLHVLFPLPGMPVPIKCPYSPNFFHISS